VPQRMRPSLPWGGGRGGREDEGPGCWAEVSDNFAKEKGWHGTYHGSAPGSRLRVVHCPAAEIEAPYVRGLHVVGLHGRVEGAL
jgi:hypothetical protein